MGKFDQIRAALEALPEARRDGDLHPESALTDDQIAELAARVANPGPIATDSELENFFARFKA